MLLFVENSSANKLRLQSFKGACSQFDSFALPLSLEFLLSKDAAFDFSLTLPLLVWATLRSRVFVISAKGVLNGRLCSPKLVLQELVVPASCVSVKNPYYVYHAAQNISSVGCEMKWLHVSFTDEGVHIGVRNPFTIFDATVINISLSWTLDDSLLFCRDWTGRNHKINQLIKESDHWNKWHIQTFILLKVVQR